MQKIPAIILGGGDDRPTKLPQGGEALHPLCGYKGVEIRIGGRPIVEHLVERLQASQALDPVYIAGPARVYRGLRHTARLIDTDTTFGGNIFAATEWVRVRHPGLPVAFTTCDVLPEAATLQGLLEDYHRGARCDIWFPLVRVPADRDRLGPSGWKPVYRVVPHDGGRAVEVLGGHVVIVEPDSLRLGFLCRLFDLAYRTRNRSIDRRRRVIVRGLLRELLGMDLRRIAAWRRPNLTWTILRAGVTTARQLREGTVTCQQLERALAAILVERSPRESRVRVPVVDALSLALDIDTEEEARAMGGNLPGA